MQAASFSARDHAMFLLIFHHGFVRPRLLPETVRHNWGSMEITIARKKGSLMTTQQLVSLYPFW